MDWITIDSPRKYIHPASNHLAVFSFSIEWLGKSLSCSVWNTLINLWGEKTLNFKKYEKKQFFYLWGNLLSHFSTGTSLTLFGVKDNDKSKYAYFHLCLIFTKSISMKNKKIPPPWSLGRVPQRLMEGLVLKKGL